MRRVLCAIAPVLVSVGVLAGQPALGDDDGDGRRLEVTVTNLTRGQTFTPVLVASHRAGVTLFALGQGRQARSSRSWLRRATLDRSQPCSSRLRA